jgi:hypothetical protein
MCTVPRELSSGKFSSACCTGLLTSTLGYCKYTPEEIGRHLRTIFVEAFGEAIFQIGAAELEEGTVFWNNLRLYKKASWDLVLWNTN